MLASMRGRLTLLFALSIALFMAVLSAGIVVYSRQLEATQLAQALESHASKYRRDLKDERRQPRSSREWQTFLDSENRTLRDFSLSMLVLDKSENVVARTHGNGPVWPLGGDWLVDTIQTRSNTLVVAARWHSTQREIRGLSSKLVLIGLFVVFATSIGSWVLVGRVLSPIDRLSHQAQAASVEDIRVQLQSPSRDVEVIGLVTTLNQFLDRLARTTESRGRFYAAASHELRTPIQGLSALLEVGLSHSRSAEQWQEIATEALGESQRLAALTQDLLTLNQLENQTVAPVLSEVDAADIIERIVNQLAAQIDEKGLQIVLDLPDDAEICAPWNHFEMLVRNIIENAVKYGQSGGEVRISLRCESEAVQFSVWNRADLPPDFDAEKLIEPFFRLNGARQSQTGGNGLGLSLVASICRANGWKLRLEHENQGLLALIELPHGKALKAH